jgi:putative NADH-flavin reductase
MVFGATGGIGRAVVAQLLDGGATVTAVIRQTADWTIEHRELQVVRIPDLSAPAPFLDAMRGSDAVISAIGPRRLSDGPVASTTMRVILEAMAETRVRRIVAVSAAPVGALSAADGLLMRRVMMPVVKALLCDLYIDLARMEGELELSGTDWTVVRPPRLSNAPAKGSHRRAIGGNVPNGFLISRADVAHAMVAALRDPATVGQAVGVAN